MKYQRILVRATNWVGDAVMCVPALQALRNQFPAAQIAILARPWVAALYAREAFCDEIISYAAPGGARGIPDKWKIARELSAKQFDCAILLQNAFEAAAIVRAAGIPVRIGYGRDGRGWLLTHPVRVPEPGEIPKHQRFYYLELFKRAGLIESYSADSNIRLSGATQAAMFGRERFTKLSITGPVIGLSPGAAYGGAKRWLPERFAEAAVSVAKQVGATIAIFGVDSEHDICSTVLDHVQSAGLTCFNFAGTTSLTEFIELAAACEVYLTNDSGPMHIASALGVPTTVVFGATDEEATGPTGPLAQVVREPVECSPCLLRECPIDHRCMTQVSAQRVATAALELLAIKGHSV
jgi:heptosyltransferase-2